MVAVVSLLSGSQSVDARRESPSAWAGTKSMRRRMSDALVGGFGGDHAIGQVVADVVKNGRNVDVLRNVGRSSKHLGCNGNVWSKNFGILNNVLGRNWSLLGNFRNIFVSQNFGGKF